MKGIVYIITNTINSKVYIGSTKQVFSIRVRQHFCKLEKNKHVNTHLQAAYNIYGKNNFKVSILEECLPEECYVREQYYIDLYTSYDNQRGYNIVKNTINFVPRKPDINRARRTLSDEIRRNMSKAQRGRIVSEECKIKMSKSHTGVPLPHKRVAVVQFDMEGNFIKEWDGCITAARELNPDNPIKAMKLISQACCRSKYPTAYGFKWKKLSSSLSD